MARPARAVDPGSPRPADLWTREDGICSVNRSGKVGAGQRGSDSGSARRDSYEREAANPHLRCGRGHRHRARVRPGGHGRRGPGQRGAGRRGADVRGGPVLAQAVAGSLGAGIGHRRRRGLARPRLHRAPRQPHRAHRGRGRRGSSDRRVLPRRAPCARVRSRWQSRQRVGRSLRRLRVARLEPRHHRRPHGQPVDRRQRAERHARPEVLPRW